MLRRMLLRNAVEHFGSCANIAHHLEGLCLPSAVYQWQGKGVVPLWAARKLAEISDGHLHVDESLYDPKGRALRLPKPKRRVA
jgi:hypothetical protein